MTAVPITVVLAGDPVAKARVKFGKNGAYTPKPTVVYQRALAWEAKTTMAGTQPLEGAVKIDVLFELAIPSSWPERKRGGAIVGIIKPTGKPDVDNYAKAALDAINGVVVVDDAQVVELSVRKVYGVDPKTILTISSLDVAAPHDITRLLQKVAAAESNADIDEISARAIEAAAGLPPHRREDVLAQFQDAINERRGMFDS